MKQVKLNTEILPLLQMEMYGTAIDPNEVSQNFYDGLDDEDPRTSETEHFNFDAYCADVKKLAQKTMDDWIMPLLKPRDIKSITFTDWFHPTDHFQAEDSLDMIVELEDGWEEYAKMLLRTIFDQSAAIAAEYKARGVDDWEDADWVQKYIKDHYVSREGFISLMPNTYEDIVKFNDERCYAVAIMLIALDCITPSVIESNQRWFEESVYEQLNYEDYTTWDEDEQKSLCDDCECNGCYDCGECHG